MLHEASCDRDPKSFVLLGSLKRLSSDKDFGTNIKAHCVQDLEVMSLLDTDVIAHSQGSGPIAPNGRQGQCLCR